VSEALPGVRWVLCEPFVLDCGVVVDGWCGYIDAGRAAIEHPNPLRDGEWQSMAVENE
jgi:hypothetical protein